MNRTYNFEKVFEQVRQNIDLPEGSVRFQTSPKMRLIGAPRKGPKGPGARSN